MIPAFLRLFCPPCDPDEVATSQESRTRAVHVIRKGGDALNLKDKDIIINTIRSLNDTLKNRNKSADEKPR